MVCAWGRTYNLPFLLTNCSNNYGPYQHPEKLIPKTILNALDGKVIPIYGTGEQIRDWLYVEDHAKALLKVLQNGEIGETYNIGGNNQIRNIDIVHKICEILEELLPSKTRIKSSYKSLIKLVADRPGHDIKYAIDSSKVIKRWDGAPKKLLIPVWKKP